MTTGETEGVGLERDAVAGFAAARALSDALRHALEWSRDVDEGMAAHREGRPPRFIGR